MSAPQGSHESGEGPQSKLERKYIQEYLHSKGASLESLGELPKAEQQRLMSEASQYASLKLCRSRIQGKVSP